MSRICDWPMCMTRQEQVDAQSAAYAKANCEMYALVAETLLHRSKVDDTLSDEEHDPMPTAGPSRIELATSIRAMAAERFPRSETQVWLVLLLTQHGTWAGREADFKRLLDMGDAEEMRFKTSIAMILAGEARIHSRAKVRSWILSLGLGDDWIKDNTKRYDRLRAAYGNIDGPPTMPTRQSPRVPPPQPPRATFRPIARKPLPPPIPTAATVANGSSVQTAPGPATQKPSTPSNTNDISSNEDPAIRANTGKKRGTRFDRIRMAAKELLGVKGKKGGR